MPSITAGDLEKRNQARMLYGAFITNQQDVNNKLTITNIKLSQRDLATVAQGSAFTTYEEQQAILRNSLIFELIISGNKSVSGSTSGLTQIDFTGISDAGGIPISGVLDDAFIPIPMGGMTFNFFGTNYSSNIRWNSNNALVFGTTFNANIVSISATTGKAILIGNYDRLCTGIHYSNSISSDYSITTLIVSFSDYYTNSPTASPIYKYQIRLIKQTIESQSQFIEVCVISSPPSPGYSSAAITYPSGSDASGNPMDSNGSAIDQTKASPYNITNGTTFLNPCGSTFSTTSPPAGSSFVFSSDSTGTSWTFRNNSYVNV